MPCQSVGEDREKSKKLYRDSYDQLAEKFGVSRRTLIRRFKAATGDTPLSYLQRFRVEIAKSLLEKKQHTFDEISYQIGYEDSTSFRKVFIQLTGLRPKEYQKKFTIEYISN
jgi:transcriptional regulator GlxA family with amidase domain